MRYRISARASAEIEDARGWYASRSTELASDFLDAVDEVIDRLRTFPLSGRVLDGHPDLRRATVQRFPYAVVYRAGDDELLVVHVLHTKRDRPAALDEPTE